MTDEISLWERDQRLVLNELKRNTQNIELLRKDIGDMRVDFAMMKIKSSLLGLVAGSIPVVVAIVIKLMNN